MHLLIFKQSKFSYNILTNITKTLKLNKIQEIALAIALQYSTKEEIKKKSQEFLKQKIADLVNSSYSDSNCIIKNIKFFYIYLCKFFYIFKNKVKELNFSEVPIETIQLILIEIGKQFKSNINLNSTELFIKLRKGIIRY